MNSGGASKHSAKCAKTPDGRKYLQAQGKMKSRDADKDGDEYGPDADEDND